MKYSAYLPQRWLGLYQTKTATIYGSR